MHVVQLTPPRIELLDRRRHRLADTPPGTVQDLQLVVPDIQAARAHLAERGVEVTPVRHYEGADLVDGPGGRWNSFVFFNDPTATAGPSRSVRLADDPGRVAS
jgi:hypothetical protein